MKNRRILSALAALSLVFGVAQAVHADAWTPVFENTPDGTMVAAITEGADYAGVSRRIVHINNANGSVTEYLCPTGHVPGTTCDGTVDGGLFYSNAVLPSCTTKTQIDCVEAVLFGKAEGELTKATYVRDVAGQKYEAGAGGLPAGGTMSVWDAPGLTHQGGTTKYAVQVNQETGWDRGTDSYTTFAISASIIPISDRSGTQYKTPNLVAYNNAGEIAGNSGIAGWEFASGCAFTEAGYCGVSQDFAADSRFSLVIRASNQITGWFKGRIQKPVVTIDKFSDTNNRITMTAEPVQVGRLAATVTAANTTDKGKQLLSYAMRTGVTEMFRGRTIRSTHPDTQDSISWVEEFRTAANDTAAGTSTLWSYATLAGGSENNECFADKTRVVGVVTTNATALAVGAPTFENGMLDYRVAGLHYAPDGKTLNEGTYDLIIRSDVARCLYGFTKAPISATIKVVGEGGENKVATVMVNEDAKTGWIKMAAYGFNFSSPTIKVKLTQAKAPAKKVTITCVGIKNKKLTKKVTAVAAKCPTGYKKK